MIQRLKQHKSHFTDVSSERQTIAGSVTSDTDVDGFNLQLEASYNYALGKTGYFSPFVGFSYTDISQDGFTEDGGLNLTVGSIDNEYSEGKIGFRLGEQIESAKSLTDLYVSLAFVSDFGDGPDDISITFANQTSAISINDTDDERGELAFGVNWYSKDNYSIGLSLDGEFADDYYSVNGNIRYRYDF